MPVAAVNAHLAVAGAIFCQADRGFALRAVNAAMQDKRLLFVADNAPRLQTAKSAPVAQGVYRFQHAGFSAAVSADQKVKARRQRQIGLFDITEVLYQQAG